MKTLKAAALGCIGITLVTIWVTYFALDASSKPVQLAFNSAMLLPTSRYDKELTQQFTLFCNEYGKNYQDREEFYKRRHYFEINLRRICSVNSEQKGACLLFENDSRQRPDDKQLDIVGMNEMADWSDQEAKERLMDKEYFQNYTNYWNEELADLTELTAEEVDEILIDADLEDLPHDHPHVMAYNGRSLPESVDWRKQGVVTPVKNQGSCGSCWAFAAVGALESAYAIRNKKLVQFSEQQMLDCVNGMGFWSKRCQGGYPSEAFKFAKSNFLAIKDNYPYRGLWAGNQKCKQKGDQMFPTGAEKQKNWLQQFLDMVFNVEQGKDTDKVDLLQAIRLARTLAKEGRLVKVEKHYRVGRDSKALKQALQIGPAVVLMDGENWFFRFYNGGIIRPSDCQKNVNHAVLAVGYDREYNRKTGEWEEYFIIKNSWGKNWGEDGYARISAQTKDNRGGTCGLFKESAVTALIMDATPDSLKADF